MDFPPHPHPWQAFTRRKEPGQTVYIFGAGASRAESARVPTNENLLTSILDGADDKIRLNIQRFLKDVYRFEPDGKKTSQEPPSFEELFTQIELALYEDKYFRSWPRNRLGGLRRDLLLAANSAIMDYLPKPPLVHNGFVDRLFRDGSQGVNNRNTSFISFNYDLALDRVLIRNREKIGDVDVEYGCYFRSFDINYKRKESMFSPARQGKELFLLKMHGSFNWTWCPTCNFARIYPEKNIAAQALTLSQKCLKCRNPVDAVLIPPAWRKALRNPNLSNIWSIAEFLLSQAEMIVFVGYSFSDADLDFKFLLRRALASKKKRPKIMVVTKNSEDDAEKSGSNPLHLRYSRFFGGIQKWDDMGFDHFSRAPIHAIRPNPGPSGTRTVRWE